LKDSPEQQLLSADMIACILVNAGRKEIWTPLPMSWTVFCPNKPSGKYHNAGVGGRPVQLHAGAGSVRLKLALMM
jgi:hypothetical protein